MLKGSHVYNSPRKPKAEKLVFDWMRGASERSKAAWEKRWIEAYYAGEKVGPKGEKFLEKTFGPEIGGEERFEEDWPDDWNDFGDEEGKYQED